MVVVKGRTNQICIHRKCSPCWIHIFYHHHCICIPWDTQLRSLKKWSTKAAGQPTVPTFHHIIHIHIPIIPISQYLTPKRAATKPGNDSPAPSSKISNGLPARDCWRWTVTPNSVSSLLRSSTWQILPISGKQKSYPTAATASVMLPNFECLLSSSCGRAAARTKPGSQISAPHSANYRLQFPFLAQEREVERCLNVVFSLFCVHSKLVQPNPFPPAF